MKTKSVAVIVSAMAVAALCLLGACFPQTSQAQTDSAPGPAPDGSVAPAAPDDSTALPPNIYPSSPLAQVIKLTQSGVSEDVIMAYVTNSGSTFNLDPDKIIYLKDIGAPDELVTAMMQRDQVLQAQMAASAYQPPPQPAPAPETVATEPVPTEPPVDQPAPVTVNYFYDSLAPYGSWVDVEGYGHCWRPTVLVANAGWQPYCDHGHWIFLPMRLVLDFGLFVGLGAVPLRTLVSSCALRLVLGAGHGLGAVLGDVALFGRLLRLGAAAAIHRLCERNRFYLPGRGGQCGF